MPRVRGVAIPVKDNQTVLSVLRSGVDYNALVSPPPPKEDENVPPPVVYSVGKADPIRTGVPQGVTDAGSSGQAPPKNAKPGAMPPVSGSGGRDWVVPSKPGSIPRVDVNGERIEESEGREGEEETPDEEEGDVTTGVFSAGTLPAGAILLRTVIEKVIKFEGDTASISVGTKDEEAKFGTISGDEDLPGGKDGGTPDPDFLEEPVEVIITVKAGENVKKYTAGGVSFAVYYIASKAQGKAGEVAPSITAINPTTAALGGESFTLQVLGKNFKDGDVILWNNGEEATEFVSPEELTTEVNMSTAEAAVTLPVQVKRGEAVSNALPFTLTEAAPAPEAESQRQEEARG